MLCNFIFKFHHISEGNIVLFTLTALATSNNMLYIIMYILPNKYFYFKYILLLILLYFYFSEILNVGL